MSTVVLNDDAPAGLRTSLQTFLASNHPEHRLCSTEDKEAIRAAAAVTFEVGAQIPWGIPTVYVTRSGKSGWQLRWASGYLPKRGPANTSAVEAVSDAGLRDFIQEWLRNIFATAPNYDDEIDRFTVRQIEVVMKEVRRLIDAEAYRLEDLPLVEAAATTLTVQMQSGKPDTTILRQALGALSTFSAGLMTGVAGNYMTDLLRSFGLPWP